MIKALNEKTDIESVLDIDSALKYIAANTVLGSYDSYSGQFAQNYYLYEQNGKFTVIPWDYNMSFGGFGQGGNATAIDLDTPVSGISMESRPLINNLLSVSEYKEKYYQYVEELTAYLEKMPERVTALAAIIRPYVEADPTKFTTMEKFENSIIYAEEVQRDSQPQQNGERPAFDPSNMPQPPEGTNTNSERGGMAAGGGSIITYATKRLANIKAQLSGEVIETDTAAQTDRIKVMVEGKEISFDVFPVIENGRTLVPLRAIFESLGMEVTFENGNISAAKEGLTIKITVGSKVAYKNDEQMELDVESKIVNGRTLVPVRFIGECAGLTVSYDQAAKTVILKGGE